jgi:WD40 repeat protein
MSALDPPSEEIESLTSPETLLKHRQFAGYELLGEIARGGMGVVFRARQRRPDRVVALKVIAAGELASPRMVERFHSETEAAARLDHPNIASIYEVGQQDGWHYFSMRLVDGPTLARKLGGCPMPAREAAQLFVKIARAVHHAHQRGVLHRDLKPNNILLDAAGEPYLTDFGLAKILESDASLTISNAVLGTPAYMPPEQASGNTKIVTIAADVYGLGAVFYEMLTGRPPFTADTTPALLRQITDEEPPAPTHVLRKSATEHRTRDSLSRELDVICLKCLEKNPAHRYTSAAELADDTERWLRGESITAQPVSHAERIRKWVRRYPARSGLIATAAIALLVITVGSLLFNVRLRQARDDAERNAADAQYQLLSNHLGNAARLTADGDAFTGGLWLLEALRHADRTTRPKILERLQLTLQFSPRLLRLRNVHGIPVRLEFSNEGHILTVSLRGGQSFAWNLPADTVTPLAPLPPKIFPAFFVSPNGLRKLGPAAQNTVALQDTRNGRTIASYPVSGPVYDVAFSPDSRQLAVASFRDQVRVYDSITGSPDGIPLVHQSGGNKALFSPDGSLLVTAGFDYRLLVRRTEDHKPIAPVITHAALIEAVAFSPDGRFLAAGDADGVLQVWDLQTALRPVLVDGGFLRRVALSPDTELIVLLGDDGTLRVHRVSDGQESGARLDAGGDVGEVRFTPDGRFLAAACRQRGVRVWNFATRELRYDWKDAGDVSRLAVHPASTAVATFARGRVQQWSLENGQPLGPALQRSDDTRIVLWSPDGRWLAAGGGTTAQVWDAATGAEAAPALRAGPKEDVTRILFSPDSRRVLVSYGNGSIEPAAAQFYALPTLALAGPPMRHGDGVSDVRFSSDGNLVATLGEDNVVRVWRTTDGVEVISPLRHDGIIHSAVFRGDNRVLVTGCSDGLLRWWDIERGELMAPPLLCSPDAAFYAFALRDDVFFFSAKHSQTWMLRLAKDRIPDDGVASLMECQSGCRIDARQRLALITAEEAEKRFTALRAVHPAFFAWPGDMASWHADQAAIAEFDRQWFAAAFHLQRLATLDSTNEAIRRRLETAKIKMAQ